MAIIKVTMSLKSPEDTQWSDICSVSGVSPESWERRTRPPPPGEPEVGFLLLFCVVIADVIVVLSCYCYWFFVLLWLMLQALQKKWHLNQLPQDQLRWELLPVGVNNVCIKKCNKFLEPKNESFSAFFCSFLRQLTLCVHISVGKIYSWNLFSLLPIFPPPPSGKVFSQWEVFFPVGRCCQGY